MRPTRTKGVTAMLFVTMLTMDPARNEEGFQAIRQVQPPNGITIAARYGLFGGRDAIVIFDAPTGERAMDFLTGTLCKLTGVSDTETFAAISLQ
ncbi:MAG: hypothetical protein QN168_08555 [Armatimonadota bacterium]|nr:hypothetical protein [Armatimonadota bacterium]